MPQLILHPWFFIFLFTWLSLLTLAPKKVTSYITLNSPTSDPFQHQISPWSWPWQ